MASEAGLYRSCSLSKNAPLHFEDGSSWLSVGTAVRTEPRPQAGVWDERESWMQEGSDGEILPRG